MAIVIVLIFVAAFAVIAPVLIYWSGAGKAGSNKKVIAALNTALGEERKEPAPVIDVRKKEQVFSSIPWLNSLLGKFDIIPRLQKVLNQAEVKWTPGFLLLISFACLGFSGYIVYLRSTSIVLGLLIGV